jgi:hypothetical protein
VDGQVGSLLDSFKASGSDSLPRSASGRKRLGWGRGLARLNSMPNSASKQVSTPGTGAGTIAGGSGAGGNLSSEVKREPLESVLVTPSDAHALLGGVSGFDNDQQGQYNDGTLQSPMSVDMSLPSPGNIAVKLEHQLDAQHQAQLEAQRIQADIDEKKNEQKKILSQLDDVDLGISKLELELNGVKRSANDLDAEESHFEEQIKAGTKTIHYLESKKRKHLEKQKTEKKKEEARARAKAKRPAIKREQAFVGMTYDRKELVQAFCEENRKRAMQADVKLLACLPKDLEIKCYNSKHYQLSDSEEEYSDLEETRQQDDDTTRYGGQPEEYKPNDHHLLDFHFDSNIQKLLEENERSHEKYSDAITAYLKHKRQDVLRAHFDLGLEYLKHREKWRRELKMKKQKKALAAGSQHLNSNTNSNNHGHRRSASFGGNSGSYKDVFPSSRSTSNLPSSSLQSPRESNRNSNLMMTGNFVRSEYEEMRIIHRLQAAEKMKTMIQIPNMILLDSDERRWRKFDTKNGLVTTLEAEREMEEERLTNMWSSRERRIFMDKYQQFPKDFTKIASFLEHRSVSDCLVFYYKNQKSEEFSSIRRKHQMKKRRLYSEAKRMEISSTPSGIRRTEEKEDSRYGGQQDKKGSGHYPDSGKANKGRLNHNEGGGAKKKAKKEKDAATKGSSKQKDQFGSKTPKDVNKAGGNGKAKKSGKEGLANGKGGSTWSVEDQKHFVTGLKNFGKDFKQIAQSYNPPKSLASVKNFYGKHAKRLGLDELVEAFGKNHKPKDGKKGMKGNGHHQAKGNEKDSAHKSSKAANSNQQGSGKNGKDNVAGGASNISRDALLGQQHLQQQLFQQQQNMGQDLMGQAQIAHAQQLLQLSLGLGGNMNPAFNFLNAANPLLGQTLLAQNNLLQQQQQQQQQPEQATPRSQAQVQKDQAAAPTQQNQSTPNTQAGTNNPQANTQGQDANATATATGKDAAAQQPLLDAATLGALQALLANVGFTLQPSNMGMNPLMSLLNQVGGGNLPANSAAAQPAAANPLAMLGLLNINPAAAIGFQHALAQQQLAQQQLAQQNNGNNNGNKNVSGNAGGSGGAGGGAQTAGVEVQKRQISYWTPDEKTTFLKTFRQHGRDWSLLSSRIPGKTVNQIKTFYQNYKQKLGLDKMTLPEGAVQPRKRNRKRPAESSAAAGEVKAESAAAAATTTTATTSQPQAQATPADNNNSAGVAKTAATAPKEVGDKEKEKASVQQESEEKDTKPPANKKHKGSGNGNGNPPPPVAANDSASVEEKKKDSAPPSQEVSAQAIAQPKDQQAQDAADKPTDNQPMDEDEDEVPTPVVAPQVTASVISQSADLKAKAEQELEEKEEAKPAAAAEEEKEKEKEIEKKDGTSVQAKESEKQVANTTTSTDDANTNAKPVAEPTPAATD